MCVQLWSLTHNIMHSAEIVLILFRSISTQLTAVTAQMLSTAVQRGVTGKIYCY